MSLRQGWGWQLPQTASQHIHIRHIQSVWAHWYAAHRHTPAVLHSYTHPTWLRFWGSGSLVESNDVNTLWLEAGSHLKLLPLSTLVIYKVFEHIDMLSTGIQQQPYTRCGISKNVSFFKWSQNLFWVVQHAYLAHNKISQKFRWIVITKLHAHEA